MFLCHSFHSLRYGTISIRGLVEAGSRMGTDTLALVDINTVSGIYEFYKECLLHRIKPVVGMNVRVDGEQLYTCLAKNPDGLAEINRMMTAHNCDGREIPRQNPDLREVFIIYPLQNIPETLGDNEFIGIRPGEANILVQREWKQKTRKMVVLQPVAFQATDDGIILSTGLTVIIGERSSGKTYTLEKICSNFENIKYMKQFSLLQNDEEKFKELVTKRHSLVSESYLKDFKNVLYDIRDIDIKSNELDLENYIESLKKYAGENDKLDSFSKCALYNSSTFDSDDLENLKKIINATEILLENVEYKEIVNRHVTEENLKALLLDLIRTHNSKYEKNLQKNWVNELSYRIKEELQFRSSTTSVTDFDFYKFQTDKLKIKKFIDLVNIIKTEKEIDSKEIREFKVVVRTKKFTGAGQLKSKSRSQLSFSSAYNNYDNPYKYFISLKEVGIEETEFYKYFVDIEYKTLNKHGFPVSGGERSEFNLLHEISDALKHDALLIDEPESSFDNIFLKNEVNELIKEIAKEIPVIVVTHNSTIGASIKPDYLLYTEKNITHGEVIYTVYSGHPTSKKLKSNTGQEIQNIDILFNCLEAGQETYYERKNRSYEILKN